MTPQITPSEGLWEIVYVSGDAMADLRRLGGAGGRGQAATSTGGNTMTPPQEQEAQWREFEQAELAKNRCPYSGLSGPECKSWLCDCFQYEDRWGVSQK